MIKKISKTLKQFEGNVVTYSRAGGGAGSILLIKSQNNISLWIWCYWEISHYDDLLATADDDTTAIVGKIAVAARQLEGKVIKWIKIDPDYYHLRLGFDDNYELFVGCESQPPEEEFPLDNWELYNQNTKINYVVGCDFSIREEIDSD